MEDYEIITINGRKAYKFPNGNIVPRIMGGSPENEDTTGETAPSGDNPDGGNNGETKVVFDQAQQEKVQELINDATRKARVKANKENEQGSTAFINSEVEKRVKEVTANQKKSDKSEVLDQAKLDQIHADWEKQREDEMAEMKSQLGSLKSKDKENALLRAIGTHDVHNPAHIMQLISGNVAIGDNGEVQIVDEDGNPKINGNLKPMQLDEFVTSWLNNNPVFKKGSGGGSGSQNSMHGGNGQVTLKTPDDWRNLSDEQKQEFIDSGTMQATVGGQVMDIKTAKNPFIKAKQKKHKGRREGN